MRTDQAAPARKNGGQAGAPESTDSAGSLAHSRKRRTGQPGMKRRRSKADSRGRSTWQLRAHVGRNPLTGKPEYITRTVKRMTEPEAAKALACLVAEATKGRPDKREGRTMDDLWHDFVETKFPFLAPGTRTGYEKVWRNHVQPSLGAMELVEVTAKTLEDLYAALARKPRRRGRKGPQDGTLSQWSVRHCHTVICSMLTAAVRWEYLPNAPHAGKICSAPPIPSKTRPRAPEAEVVKALLAEADADQLAFDRIAAITGTRRGETGALRWSDLDWETRALEIDEALKIEWVEIAGQEKRRKSITVGPTKTHSERTLMLDSATVEILREFRGYQESRAKVCGVTLAEDSFIFSDDVEGRDPVDPDKWSARWRRLCTRLGVTGVRFHDLRHFVGVNLAPKGLRVVMDQLGHSRMSTSAIYQAVDVSELAANTMAEALA